MVSIFINEREFFVHSSLSVLEACQYVGIKIPRFCYHERLSIAGNCRMCLVETDKSPKPVAACATPLLAGMSVYTETPMVLKSRETVLETLLINHPLDCPICDQGGECDLQDQYFFFGAKTSRFTSVKRSVDDIYMGPVIKMIMTRCIHCTRCVRFIDEICGTPIFGTLNRGTNTEIGNYTRRLFLSEMSGNVVDLCPVGALTTITTAFKFRPWELNVAESLDLMDGSGSNIYLHYTDFGIVRILPKKNIEINEVWLFDKARFGLTTLMPMRVPTVGDWGRDNQVAQSGASFLVADDIDLATLRSLREISYTNLLPIVLERFGLKLVRSNTYFPSARASFLALTNMSGLQCYLLGVDPQTECLVLNTRIRARFRQGLMVSSFGFFYNASYSVAFIRLQISEILDIFRGRSSICFWLKNDVQSAIICGHALATRVSDLFSCLRYLSGVFPNVLYYFIQLHSNSEGLDYFGINSYTRRRRVMAPTFCLQLTDSILLRKYLSSGAARVAWCNTFYSDFWTMRNFIFLKSVYEIGGLFINLEQRVQQASTQQLLRTTAHAKSYSDLLAFIFKAYTPGVFYDYSLFQEYAQQAASFAQLSDRLPFLDMAQPSVVAYSNYPLKPAFDNSYLSTPTGQHSVLAARLASEARFFDALF